MSFKGIRKSIIATTGIAITDACREGAIPADHAPAHRNDESPAGYSSAGCSPAVPASASPAGAILLGG
jgi:hypothetical protein